MGRRSRVHELSGLALAAGILALAPCFSACGFSYSYWTGPTLFVHPGARSFFLKREHVRETEYSPFVYHRASYGGGLLETEYTEVQLDTCRTIAKRSFDTERYERAWGANGELWASDIQHVVLESLHGSKVTRPTDASYAGTEGAPPACGQSPDPELNGAARFYFSPASAGRPPTVWDLFSNREHEIPGATDSPTRFDPVLADATRTVALRFHEHDTAIETIIVENADVSIRRLTLETHTTVWRTGMLVGASSLAIVDNERGELFDLVTGQKLRDFSIPSNMAYSHWAYAPELTFAYLTAAAGGSATCERSLWLNQPEQNVQRRIDLPGCVTDLHWLNRSPFAVLDLAAPSGAVRWLLDSGQQRLIAATEVAGNFILLDHDLYYTDVRPNPNEQQLFGLRATRRLLIADFSARSARLVTAQSDVGCVGAEPVSHTLIYTAGGKDVYVLRSGSKTPERCSL